MIIRNIEANNFKKYGWVIEYPDKSKEDKKKNLFRIVLKEPRGLGWRIAYLIVRDKVVDKLEQHPQSYESFEPVKGRSVLFVSESRDFKKIKSFYLDKPVILKKKIWHGIVSLTNETEVKITENAKVKCVYWLVNLKRGKS